MHAAHPGRTHAGGVDLQRQPLFRQQPQQAVNAFLPAGVAGRPPVRRHIAERVGQVGQRMEFPPRNHIVHRIKIPVHLQPDIPVGVIIEIIVRIIQLVHRAEHKIKRMIPQDPLALRLIEQRLTQLDPARDPQPAGILRLHLAGFPPGLHKGFIIPLFTISVHITMVGDSDRLQSQRGRSVQHRPDRCLRIPRRRGMHMKIHITHAVSLPFPF